MPSTFNDIAISSKHHLSKYDTHARIPADEENLISPAYFHLARPAAPMRNKPKAKVE